MHYLVVPLILLKLKKNLTSKDAKLSLEVKILCTLQVNSPSILKMSIEDNQLENTYIKTLQRVYWNLIDPGKSSIQVCHGHLPQWHCLEVK